MKDHENIPDPSTWILFSDEDLLVVNKPPGLLSIPDGYQRDLPHLTQTLSPFVGKLWIVHRLDRETSGVMLLARSAEAHRILNEAFRQRALKKQYHCLAAPVPEWDFQDLSLPLRVNADRAHRTRVDFEKGKAARTLVRVLRRGSSFCLLECELHSGYTHQIRAHLYHAGLGILGDSLYRPKALTLTESSLSAPRTMLHAYEIRFAHPRTHFEMAFQAPYPPDFESKLAAL
ncbi:MAG: RluA family pseudouridine synthase [Chloroflexi bacterium]|jgi:RluA family pseudouridine synthase|nr:RluA family pseudouridine synthase [Anaerolineaceae bacterium]NLI45342.1 RluA family pseudouridine synthase [Chloroflexota bacterium]HOE34564.1 RluA family pseudouridine synthase [Anaerolineaceae bacterium]HOT25022.1 RluA family pseudouridine synthase [Anaerolineaceae bacterium]HQH57674.1 RluA family pseudouridine synthase [Anaerolineaceae bacterium]